MFASSSICCWLVLCVVSLVQISSSREEATSVTHCRAWRGVTCGGSNSSRSVFLHLVLSPCVDSSNFRQLFTPMVDHPPSLTIDAFSKQRSLADNLCPCCAFGTTNPQTPSLCWLATYPPEEKTCGNDPHPSHPYKSSAIVLFSLSVVHADVVLFRLASVPKL